MNKITLVTTEGCLGCEVMKASIKEALSTSKVDVAFDIVDGDKVNKQFIKEFKIGDFPATLFFKDGRFLFKKIGSVPAVVVTQWIKVNFK